MRAILCISLTLMAALMIKAAKRPSEAVPGDTLSLYCWTEAETAAISDEIKSAFGVYEISPEVKARMAGKSYPSECPIPIADLRYLIIPHYDGHGYVKLGEMVCHKDVANTIIAIFRDLYAAEYPIERMVLIDEYDADDERSMAANNTSCFCYRAVAGSRKLSRHSYGKAVDINPLYNPYVRPGKKGTIVTPREGKKWADRNCRDIPYAVRRGDAAWLAFTSRGWRWGGSWRFRKDYQHFELRR